MIYKIVADLSNELVSSSCNHSVCQRMDQNLATATYFLLDTIQFELSLPSTVPSSAQSFGCTNCVHWRHHLYILWFFYKQSLRSLPTFTALKNYLISFKIVFYVVSTCCSVVMYISYLQHALTMAENLRGSYYFNYIWIKRWLLWKI
jgi:hypothetical protein